MKNLIVIGLGKMGFNMAINAKEKGYNLFVYDVNLEIEKKATKSGFSFFADIDSLIKKTSSDKRVILLSLPAGDITNNTIKKLSVIVAKDDIIIDGGNAFYKDSLVNYEFLKEKQIQFMDAGISGGISGARHGACFMVGGDESAINYTKKLFADLAIEEGFFHTGKTGSGHFAKMIHNGIEYGMMQAIGEGFDILDKSEFDYDFAKLANVWNHGSIITSSLMGWTKNLFEKEGNKLKNIPSYIKSSGEGLWTVKTALEVGSFAPTITLAMLNRIKTMDKKNTGDRVVSGMRREFGGHNLK